MSERIRRPAARASAARDMLDATDAFRPGTRDAIRAGMPPEARKALDEAPGITWLEFEHDRWLMDGTMAVLGRDQAIACWRQAIGSLEQRPLLRGLAEPALRLFLGRPGRIVQLIPRAWSLAYRDFCTPSFHLLGTGRAELHFDDVAPQAFEAEGYLHCWHAICLGVFDLERPRGGVVEYRIDRTAARAVARFRWTG